VLAGRRRDRLEALAAKLPTPAHIVELDVRSRGEVEAALSSLPAPFAEVDILVNNAGLGLGMESAHTASLDDWDAMIDTNCKGLVYVTRAVLPGMVQSSAPFRGSAASRSKLPANPDRRCS
jgi:3-hydroxy acid dehydrogenase/malonic semialdehyde reductase